MGKSKQIVRIEVSSPAIYMAFVDFFPYKINKFSYGSFDTVRKDTPMWVICFLLCDFEW